MARIRVGGRFESDGVTPVTRRRAEPAKDETAGRAAGASVGAPRPRLCRAFVRKRMAERMPEMVEMLMKQANGGSLGHLKILVALAGLDKGEVTVPVKRREKSLEKILLEQWGKDDAVDGAGDAANDLAENLLDPLIAESR